MSVDWRMNVYTRKVYPNIDKLVDNAQGLQKELENYRRFVSAQAEYYYRDEVNANARIYMVEGWDENAAREQAVDDLARLSEDDVDEYEIEMRRIKGVLDILKLWIPD